ncbi:MAG: exodeoxyribonuclease III [Candidatus Ryanbacteria bacterium RIFCSPHIGHO2_02_FULL_45_43]|uniref:Exodeoxyribonuclease III n=1 Tax=Candidatus Ryanbacteria bacterium RIFCSPHIGHO2_01_45_13 TaxID=1802112 RepID=A0A1G2FXR5_9BACT|nr:MAG: exodeoxyribonuclease III [Candidatus Ryanbacteria bacterium RIFCSPHIGHO2_01_FULL_44_130]OGZ42874.1 MAG: exodeoxyribonuclease III [Candidatus Ryanbacteria bacterium RIFCSPHIGHO2_01_45_13]OGZ48132.1 MAG: exodeoxyribonuclease III [Candidatus Ryanbacteria bacterium RIFCSPHIGHO2_02_FULL_45_43]OGZ49780.1 MAG: exodeoxyribonuclease III [Candidatus Ryanbacteria bacterium RIFCSPHIGHO2_12_FULL_44_20]OGZ51206.1 MAG: exodeoxyribonuclease III [Candidatus Ryanbacteria bacterium RIFCSPLOWO2_01_FULL_44_
MNTRTLLSWNVNGIRAIERKGFLDWFLNSGGDIVALQETKVSDFSSLSDTLQHPAGFHAYWNSCVEKKGYSGVVVYTKIEPRRVKTDFGDNFLSQEGRMIECDFGTFVLLNAYFPNGGSGEKRLQYKLTFYNQFLPYVKELAKSGRHVIFCGDVNTAHKEIDLARPKENKNNTGFLPIERKWIDDVINAGFIDTFRMFNSEGGYYTYWDLKTFARDRNVGWRIDYFFASESLKSRVKDAFIAADVLGSDHCPIGIIINV